MRATSDSGQQEWSKLITYQQMRTFIGVLALLLPWLMILGYSGLASQTAVLGSISEYYYSVMRDVFVGILCVVAFFLFAYRGYDRKENRLFNVAGALCLVVAFLSTNAEPRADGVPLGDLPAVCVIEARPAECGEAHAFSLLFGTRVMLRHRSWVGAVHFVAAAALFVILGWTSFALFTKKAPNPTPRKKLRNLLYRICGVTIWVSLGGYALYAAATDWLHLFNPVGPVLLLVEGVCLTAFGASWLVKGDAVPFLNDQREEATRLAAG